MKCRRCGAKRRTRTEIVDRIIDVLRRTNDELEANCSDPETEELAYPRATGMLMGNLVCIAEDLGPCRCRADAQTLRRRLDAANHRPRARIIKAAG